MKYLCAVLLQLVSFAAIAATANGSLSVTVTVVRPAPVTTVTDANGRVVTQASEVAEPSTTTTSTRNGVRYVVVTY